jgi:hypothetical protein
MHGLRHCPRAGLSSQTIEGIGLGLALLPWLVAHPF